MSLDHATEDYKRIYLSTVDKNYTNTKNDLILLNTNQCLKNLTDSKLIFLHLDDDNNLSYRTYKYKRVIIAKLSETQAAEFRQRKARILDLVSDNPLYTCYISGGSVYYQNPIRYNFKEPLGEFDLTTARQKMDSLLMGLNMNKKIVAGGAVLSSLQGEWYTSNDVDIFIYDVDLKTAEEMINQALHHFKTVDPKLTIELTQNAVTFVVQGVKIQIVNTVYKSIAHILDSFDVDCCCACYDGRDFYTSERGQYCYETLTNTINYHLITKSYFTRICKYIRRGFFINAPNSKTAPNRALGLRDVYDYLDGSSKFRPGLETTSAGLEMTSAGLEWTNGGLDSKTNKSKEILITHDNYTVHIYKNRAYKITVRDPDDFSIPEAVLQQLDPKIHQFVPAKLRLQYRTKFIPNPNYVGVW